MPLSLDSLKKSLQSAYIALLLGVFVLPVQAQQRGDHRCNLVVIAFVGGIGTAHFPPSVAVRLLHRLESRGYPGVCLKEVSAYCPWCAHRWVRREFNQGSNRLPTKAQLENGPKVILYGYSLGAPSALYLARQLESDGIPIELVITVDSKGFTRGIIPRNVKVAANFYESGFLAPITGKRNMRSEDPLATHFLGNIRVEHVGHLRIAGSAPVQQLLISTARALAYKNEDFAAELEDRTLSDADRDAVQTNLPIELSPTTPENTRLVTSPSSGAGVALFASK